MKKIILSLLILSFTFVVEAERNEKGTGPYKRSNKANLAQKIVHVLDNSTVGAVQTVLGLTHVIVYGILNPINDKDFGVGTHNNEKSEVSQFVVKTDAINACAYSLGLFQVGDCAHDHEGGHSVASGAMGPVYLPTVLLSYILEKHEDSFFESWADMEADPAEFMNTGSVQVGLGSINYACQPRNAVVFKFKIEQRQKQSFGVTNADNPIDSDKVFQWVNTNIVTPLIRNQDSDPVLVEFDLLKKNLNLVVDNLPGYLLGDKGIRNVILTEQKYVHIENNPALKKIHIRALDWTAQYGIQYNLGKRLSVTPRAGFGASIGGFSRGGRNYESYLLYDQYELVGSLSFVAGLDVKIFDYASLTGTYQKEWFSNGLTKATYSGLLHNEYRDPFKKISFVQYVDFGAGYKVETWESPTEKTKWSQWNATLGVRF